MSRSEPRRFPVSRRSISAILAAAAATFVAAPFGSSASAPAQASPSLVVAPTAISADGASSVVVSGRGYLVPPHAPGTDVSGGVYVLFGWVAPNRAWGPSARNAQNSDGQFGTTYSYPGEAGSGETRDEGGSSRFVSFTSGGTSGQSTSFHMDDAGNWSTTLTIPGPVYEWSDPATGQRATVDCRAVQCGVYTLGAHGRASSTNERFAPVIFAAAANPAAANPAPAPVPAPAASAGTSGQAGSSAAPVPTTGSTTSRGVTPTTAARAGAASPSPTAPGATAPGATALGGPIPDASASTSVPDGSVPESSVPDGGVPDTSVPDTSVPADPESTAVARGQRHSPSGDTGSITIEAQPDGSGWLVLAGGSALTAGSAAVWILRRKVF